MMPWNFVIGSGSDFALVWRRDIAWTSAKLLSNRQFGATFDEI